MKNQAGPFILKLRHVYFGTGHDGLLGKIFMENILNFLTQKNILVILIHKII